VTCSASDWMRRPRPWCLNDYEASHGDWWPPLSRRGCEERPSRGTGTRPGRSTSGPQPPRRMAELAAELDRMTELPDLSNGTGVSDRSAQPGDPGLRLP
jgi:hypothetical protein